MTTIISLATNEVEKIIEVGVVLVAKLYKEATDVDRRLSPFGVTRGELVDAIGAIAAERGTTIVVDPLGTAGQLSYIAGTRYLRLTLMPKGYVIDRSRNIESAVHRKRGIKVAYQNVDTACSLLRPPKAISGKRSASAELIGDAQGSLFSGEDLPAAIDPAKLARLSSSVWYLCVSFDADGDIRAELSLPATIKNRNFHGFVERIFLIQRGEFAAFEVPDETDIVEAEPLIARR